MSKTTKTKDELSEENKLLKEKLKGMVEKVKQTIVGEELDSIGFSMVKTGDAFNLVKIKFNVETHEARVESITPISPNPKDMAVAMYQAKKFLVDEIFQKLK